MAANTGQECRSFLGRAIRSSALFYARPGQLGLPKVAEENQGSLLRANVADCCGVWSRDRAIRPRRFHDEDRKVADGRATRPGRFSEDARNGILFATSWARCILRRNGCANPVDFAVRFGEAAPLIGDRLLQVLLDR